MPDIAKFILAAALVLTAIVLVIVLVGGVDLSVVIANPELTSKINEIPAENFEKTAEVFGFFK